MMQSADDLAPRFKRLYHHLYTNASSSRAEAILSELAAVLLIKLAAERAGAGDLLDDIRTGRRTLAQAIEHLCSTGHLRAEMPSRLSDALVQTCLEELEGLTLSGAPAHIIGEAFQAVMGPRLRGERGQFFTPTSLGAAMVKILDPKPSESVVDPACGTGGFLLHTNAHQAAIGEPTAPLIGVDKDSELARLAGAIMGVVAGPRGAVHCMDSLALGTWDGLGPPGGFDVVLTNPPFGAKIPVRDPRVLAGYELALPWRRQHGRWVTGDGPRRPRDPQLLFVELCLGLLRPGGRLGVVLPEGLFGNRRTGFLWDWLRRHARITALIDVPRTAFQPGTDTKTNVVFLEKRPTEGIEQVWIAKADTCGQDRRGKSTLADGSPHPDDFPRIGADYATRASEPSVWSQCRIHQPDYLVPRYYLSANEALPWERELTAGAQWAKLGELIARGTLTISKGHEVGAEAYGTGHIPFVRTSDLANFEIRSDPSKSVSEDVYRRFEAGQDLRAGDVLLAVDGRYRIGATAMVTRRNRQCVVQSHLRILRAAGAYLDGAALLFALNLPVVQARMQDLVFIQSTLGTVGPRLSELRIPLLGGAGPWASRINAFRAALDARSEGLAALTALLS